MVLKILFYIAKAVCYMVAIFIIILALDIIISGSMLDRVPLVGFWMRQLAM